MGPLHLTILLLVYGSIIVASFDELEGCGFTVLPLLELRYTSPSNNYKTFTAASVKDCMAGCVCSPRCAGGYNSQNKKCYIKLLSARPYEWSQHLIFQGRRGGLNTLVSFVANTTLLYLDQPTLFWPFDKYLKHNHLGGIRTPMLKLSDHLDYNSAIDGPIAPISDKSNDLKYPFFGLNKAIKFENDKNSLISSKYFINFKRAVTIMMWTYTAKKTKKVQMPLFEAIGNDTIMRRIKRNIRIEMRVMDEGIQLIVSRTNVATTTSIPLATGKWQHIAVSCNNEFLCAVYLNGKVWQLMDLYSLRGSQNVHVDEVYIGTNPSPFNAYEGHISCTLIFERALTMYETRAYMKACP